MSKKSDNLSRYYAKRDFTKTPEPPGKVKKSKGNRYLIQKHAATRLHYDFRLELDGTLKSWAVTKGPSLDPHDRRLAVEVEDHPVEYGSFEGIIPKGQYGGGTVMLWDTGSWEPLGGDPHKQLAKGKLSFLLHGQRLRGEWTLVKMHNSKDKKRNNWLLIKKEDEEAKPGDGDILLREELTSVVSGRTMEEIAEDRDRTWQSKPRNADAPPPRKKAAKPFKTSGLGKKKSMPSFIPPELATLSDAMPRGEGWLHEIKFDGYRIQAHVKNGKAKMLTRTGKDWTHKFGTLPAQLAELPVESVIIDGELIAMDEQGDGSFKALQNALMEGDQEPLQYYVFDLLYLNGEDLTGLSLIKRKETLQALLQHTQGRYTHSTLSRIIYSDHFPSEDGSFLQHACRLELEGVISKKADAPYRSGRGKSWLKAKCHQRQEFVIGGFTLPTRGNRGIGALLLGYYEDDKLIYSGKVGTGFDNDLSLQMRKKLDALQQKQTSFTATTADARRGAHWVEPKLVCEVEFTEWTTDGRLRHPSFQGLREDKPAKSVHRDVPVKPTDASASDTKVAALTRKASKSNKQNAIVGGITITHPDRVIYPAQGITKLQLAEYYHEMAEWIMPYLENRPISIIRCPEGMAEECFFQRHLGRAQSPYFHEAAVAVKGTRRPYLMIKDVQGLISLIQWGVIEIHPWGARTDTIDTPDYITFDLDPDPGVKWAQVMEAAKEVRERLKQLGLTSFLKTTGGKGLHITALIAPRYPWGVVKPFSKAIAESMVQDSPDRYTATLSKAARKGRIFIDYLRNELTATAIASYSARAREGATVSIPLDWKQLNDKLHPKQFTIETVPALLAKRKHDPWEGFFSLKQTLPKELVSAIKKQAA